MTHTDARTLDPLSYSDGEKHSKFHRGSDGRRVPDLSAVNYYKHDDFINWATASGYRRSARGTAPAGGTPGPPEFFYGLFDRSAPDQPGVAKRRVRAGETYYFDFDGSGYLSDDERDEDGDGLSNYDETHGRMTQKYWDRCCESRPPSRYPVRGHRRGQRRPDGDGVRDGADDQDHDDIPNLMELSRIAASQRRRHRTSRLCQPRRPARAPETNHPDDFRLMNPFNPCLPATWSRTCPSHPNATTGAPFDNSPNWYSLN